MRLILVEHLHLEVTICPSQFIVQRSCFRAHSQCSLLQSKHADFSLMIDLHRSSSLWLLAVIRRCLLGGAILPRRQYHPLSLIAHSEEFQDIESISFSLSFCVLMLSVKLCWCAATCRSLVVCGGASLTLSREGLCLGPHRCHGFLSMDGERHDVMGPHRFFHQSRVLVWSDMLLVGVTTNPSPKLFMGSGEVALGGMLCFFLWYPPKCPCPQDSFA